MLYRRFWASSCTFSAFTCTGDDDRSARAGLTHDELAYDTRATCRVKKTVLFYGILGGVLIAVLKIVEYRNLVLEHSLEIYGGIVALIFSVLGIWLGLKLTRAREGGGAHPLKG